MWISRCYNKESTMWQHQKKYKTTNNSDVMFLPEWHFYVLRMFKKILNFKELQFIRMCKIIHSLVKLQLVKKTITVYIRSSDLCWVLLVRNKEKTTGKILCAAQHYINFTATHFLYFFKLNCIAIVFSNPATLISLHVC